jgi:hypothetical protein
VTSPVAMKRTRAAHELPDIGKKDFVGAVRERSSSG